MNMNFQKPHRLKQHYLRREDYFSDLQDASNSKLLGYRKLALWLIIATGLAYLATNATAVILLIIAAVVLVLFCLATAVCIYAQNNTW